MRLLNILIIIFLTGFAAFGQDKHKNTFLERLNSDSVSSNNKDFLKSSFGAEKFIDSLLGNTFYNDHIKIDIKQTRKENFDVYIRESGNDKLIESHAYYNIKYYLLDKNDTLSYFNLLVDSLGIPTKYDKDYYFFFSPTKIFSYYKCLFTNKFKIDFIKAVEIGRQHGFETKPFLNYEAVNKKGIYWSFSKKFVGGTRKLMDINAKTGSVKVFYMPALEE